MVSRRVANDEFEKFKPRVGEVEGMRILFSVKAARADALIRVGELEGRNGDWLVKVVDAKGNDRTALVPDRAFKLLFEPGVTGAGLKVATVEPADDDQDDDDQNDEGGADDN